MPETGTLQLDGNADKRHTKISWIYSLNNDNQLHKAGRGERGSPLPAEFDYNSHQHDLEYFYLRLVGLTHRHQLEKPL
jgi:hypothetical protein